MQANEVIKNLMAQKEITQTEMREKMEMKSQSGVSQALNRCLLYTSDAADE